MSSHLASIQSKDTDDKSLNKYKKDLLGDVSLGARARALLRNVLTPVSYLPGTCVLA